MEELRPTHVSQIAAERILRRLMARGLVRKIDDRWLPTPPLLVDIPLQVDRPGSI